MKMFGFEITRTRKANNQDLTSPSDRGWFPLFRWPGIHEPFTGAWQRNKSIKRESVITYSAVYACVTLIAHDIAKLGLVLKEQDDDGIWTLTKSSAFSPVLRRPNHFQNKIKFIEQWMVSKLLAGNTYVLLQRDNRSTVDAMYVLDPNRVKVLVSPSGEIFYDLATDNLAGIEESTITVPASEIMHDVETPIFGHPLCGISPLTACLNAAAQGLAIQNQSTAFFENGSRPGGIIVHPTTIPDDQAKRIKEYWENNYSGENAGRIAVLGDGMKFEQVLVKAIDAQLIEQLKWTAETVCSCFHVPPYMIGVGEMPNYNNIEALNLQYYQQALQTPIECIEALLDEGLGLTEVPNRTLGTEFDLDDLIRMDTASKVRTAVEGLKGIFTTNEVRRKFDLVPKPGGDAVLVQQQNFSIEALAKRDAKEDPFGTAAPPAPRNDDANAGNSGNADESEVPDEELEATAALAAWELKTQLAA